MPPVVDLREWQPTVLGCLFVTTGLGGGWHKCHKWREQKLIFKKRLILFLYERQSYKENERQRSIKKMKLKFIEHTIDDYKVYSSVGFNTKCYATPYLMDKHPVTID